MIEPVLAGRSSGGCCKHVTLCGQNRDRFAMVDGMARTASCKARHNTSGGRTRYASQQRHPLLLLFIAGIIRGTQVRVWTPAVLGSVGSGS